MSVKRKVLFFVLPAVFSVVLFLAGFKNLENYHITWDEALGEFFFGQRYASFFLTFDLKYLDFERNPYPDSMVPDLSESFNRGRPQEHYAVGSTLGALCCKVFFEKMGCIRPFEAFHSVNLFFAVCFVWAFYLFLSKEFSVIHAVFTVAFLFSCPRFFAHLMANVKDIPLLVLYSLTVVQFFRACKTVSFFSYFKAGVLLGVSLATKTNAIFVPVIVFVSLTIECVCFNKRLGSRQIGFLVISGFVSLFALVLFWPYLWPSPVIFFKEHLYYLSLMHSYIHPDNLASPLLNLFGTMPVTVAVFILIGFFSSFNEMKNGSKFYLWCYVWIGVVLGRFLLPQAVNFDGIRHFIEVLPPFMVIAASGLNWFLKLISNRRVWGRGMLGIFFVLPGYYSIFDSNPFQIVYWNQLVGGYHGARNKNFAQASDYWGMSYALGLKWINENVPNGSLLAVPIMEHCVRISAPVYLRKDIDLCSLTTPFSSHITSEKFELLLEASKNMDVYVMFVPRCDWKNQLMEYCEKHLKPVKSWEYDEEAVLLIFKLI